MTARLEHPSAAVRLRVMKRDRFQCTYCGVAGTDAELEIDHIVAVAHGGSHHMSNLTTACRACNQTKGDRPAPRRTHTQTVKHNDQHPLVGMCFHSFRDTGHFYQQGHILAVDGDIVLVQLYSWVDGGCTLVEKLEKSYVYSDRVVLYACHEDMNNAWEKQCARAKYLRQEISLAPNKVKTAEGTPPSSAAADAVTVQ